MALANVAWILASAGKKVLAIDWDLEAPGLLRYFHPFLIDKQLTSSEGVIDCLIDYCNEAMTPLEGEHSSARDWYVERANIARYAVSLDWEFPHDGVLDVIPAGRQGPSYATRVTGFNWQDFYDRFEGGTFLEVAKQRVRENYDYILIDSRTGVGDAAGICTVQLPDVLVVCFTLNTQSMEGAAGVAASVRRQREGRPVTIFPVPMRVEETAEKERLEFAREEARDLFTEFIDHLTVSESVLYWDRIEAVYVPFYAFEEILAPFGDRPGQSRSMLAWAERLTGYLSGFSVSSLTELPEEKRLEKLEEFKRGGRQRKLQFDEEEAGSWPTRLITASSLTVPPAYSAWLQKECAEIELRGLKLKQGQAVRLNHVYVPLTTSAGGEEQRGQRPPERLEGETPRLLFDLLGKGSLYVSGAPGSGKSMFCRWVAWLACAGEVPRHEVEAPEGYAETLDASLRDRLPLLVRLRDFWSFLPAAPGRHALAPGELERALAAWVDAKQLPGIAWADVRAHVERGSMLLILDGVDEVPVSVGEEQQASHPRTLLLAGLAAAVPAWVKAGNRVLLTSRPYGLTEGEARKLSIAQAPVEDLADEAQALLARRWFHALAEDRAVAEATAGEMLEHVREREWLEPLTGNPMLLTTMCIVYGEGKRLPQDKHDLYSRIVDNVLHNRYADDSTQIDLVRVRLSVVAHGMHTGEGLGERRSTPQAEATYAEIDRMIQVYREQSSWTEPGFKGAVTTREDLLSQSGLLLPRADRRAGFYHLSLQDFLAAERLADLDSDRLPVVFQDRAAAPEWRPALSFVFGSVLAKNTSPERAVRLLTRLVELAGPDAFGLQVVIGECVEVLLGRGIHLQAADEARVRAFCLSAIEREAPLRERHALGLTLGRLGDPRVVTDLRDPSAYVDIPAGDYVIGDERRPLRLERPLRMSRYPVTNSQYARFVGDGGYDEESWWSTGGRQWRRESGAREPAFWRRGRWNNPSQPVVGVSFWEAEAFCSWAGERLPVANEWECAARGPEGLDYPWGNDWVDGICNTAAANLGVTSVVGLFPRAKSKAFGLHDMAGNVLEWSRDSLEDGKGSREVRAVVRGGSWNFGARGARSAFRFDDHPGVRVDYVGFRVVGAGGVRTP